MPANYTNDLTHLGTTGGIYVGHCRADQGLVDMRHHSMPAVFALMLVGCPFPLLHLKSFSLSELIPPPKHTSGNPTTYHSLSTWWETGQTIKLVMILNRHHITGPNIQFYRQTQTVTKFRYLLGLTDLSWQLSGILCWYWRATDKDTYKAVSDSARRKTCHTKDLNVFVAPPQSRWDQQKSWGQQWALAQGFIGQGPWKLHMKTWGEFRDSQRCHRCELHAQICSYFLICKAKCVFHLFIYLFLGWWHTSTLSVPFDRNSAGLLGSTEIKRWCIWLESSWNRVVPQDV